MTTTINASTTAGLVQTADTSGVLALQTAGTTAVSISASQVVTVTNDTVINGITVGKGGGAVSTNTAVGVSALAANQAGGTNNTAIGNSALDSNTTGDANTAVGDNALQANTTASNNTAVGYQAGYSQTTSPDNVFMGNKAGYLTSTGSGSNTFIGQQAGYSHTTGQNNQFFGGGSGYYITTGSKNTVIGAYTGNQGGLDIRTASNNIVLSDGDGNIKFSASASFFSLNGFNADGDIGGTPATTTWSSNLSDGVRCNQPGTSYWNRASDGNVINWRKAGTSCGNISVSGTSTTYGTSSDYRLKENITPMTGALAKVAQLKPVTYTWKEDGKPSQGFIAHEIQAIVPECVVGEKDAVDKDGNPDPQNLDTSFLVATLTAAIQELKTIVDAQAELISGQAATINALVTRIEALENRA